MRRKPPSPVLPRNGCEPLDYYNSAKGISERLAYQAKENKNMEEQMEQVWRSKDGKCVGSQAEVEAYLATLSPLGKMRFPYFESGQNVFALKTNYACFNEELKALVAFANLAPLMQEAIEAWDAKESDWRTYPWGIPVYVATTKLFLAYEEALKLVPR